MFANGMRSRFLLPIHKGEKVAGRPDEGDKLIESYLADFSCLSRKLHIASIDFF